VYFYGFAGDVERAQAFSRRESLGPQRWRLQSATRGEQQRK